MNIKDETPALRTAVRRATAQAVQERPERPFVTAKELATACGRQRPTSALNQALVPLMTEIGWVRTQDRTTGFLGWSYVPADSRDVTIGSARATPIIGAAKVPRRLVSRCQGCTSLATALDTLRTRLERIEEILRAAGADIPTTAEKADGPGNTPTPNTANAP